MKAIALLAALTIAAPGCYTTTGKIAGGVAGVSSALAVATLASPGRCSNEECTTGKVAGAGLFLVVATIAAITGLVAEHDYRPEPSPPAALSERPGPPGAVVAVSHACESQACELGVSANVEASLGHCAAATILAERVRELDGEYYRTVIAVDSAIARCGG